MNISMKILLFLISKKLKFVNINIQNIVVEKLGRNNLGWGIGAKFIRR